MATASTATAWQDNVHTVSANVIDALILVIVAILTVAAFSAGYIIG